MIDNPISKRILNLPIFIIFAVIFGLLSVTLVITLRAALKSWDAPVVTIDIVDGYPISRLEVYCNDVYLGNTPFCIPLEEFKKKVTKWNEPPRQERVRFTHPRTETEAAIPDSDYARAKFCYAPRDGVLSAYPRFTPPGSLDRKKEYAIQGRYWIQYKKQGCLAGLPLFIDGYSSGGGRYELTVSYNPSITFFSQEEHLHHVLLALREQNFHPNREWIDRVLEYKDFLVHELVWFAKNDARVEDAIDALVTAEFELPVNPSEERCKRILDEILDRAEEAKGFSVPSLESYAMDRIAPLVPNDIARKYEELLKYLSPSYRTVGNTFGEKPLIRYNREGKAARKLPLEYAIKRYHPPQAFDRLVYEYAKDPRNERAMVLIANYPGEKSRRLFQGFLDSISSERFPSFPYHFTEIRNTELIGDIMQFGRSLPDRHKSNERRYIASLIDNPKVTPNEKVLLILQSDMDAFQKMGQFVQIDCQSAYIEATNLFESSDLYKNTWLERLSENPNPAFEEFVLAESNKVFESETGSSLSDNALRALCKANTPQTRERIIEIWNQYPSAQKSILGILQEVDRYGDLLPQWTDFLSTIEDNTLRIQAVGALTATDTDESRAVLKAWMEDSSEIVREAIQQAMREREETMERARKLIAGTIHPDDLLPPSPAYVWNGEDYVRESE